MTYIKREIDINATIVHKSCLLFGPRAVGKSSWLRHSFPQMHYINLLIGRERRAFLGDPSLLQDICADGKKTEVIIDEVQKVPELLDEVHHLIESKGIKFILTGSSARKLKRSQANMLAGRATTYHMFPLTWRELTNDHRFDLSKYLIRGGLPSVYLSEYDYREELDAYVETYLREEITEETSIRNLRGFERFLEKAAVYNTETINYSNIASDIQISAPTIREYFEVLSDTLLGYRLEPWQSSKRKAVQTAKFYYFDLGVVWHLLNVKELNEHSDLFGKAFETFLINEFRALFGYHRHRVKMSFWRTTDQEEVDLNLNNDVGIEIEATKKVESKDLRGLRKLAEEGTFRRLIIVSRDPIKRLKDGVEHWPWEAFLEDIWARGEI